MPPLVLLRCRLTGGQLREHQRREGVPAVLGGRQAGQVGALLSRHGQRGPGAGQCADHDGRTPPHGRAAPTGTEGRPLALLRRGDGGLPVGRAVGFPVDRAAGLAVGRAAGLLGRGAAGLLGQDGTLRRGGGVLRRGAVGHTDAPGMARRSSCWARRATIRSLGSGATPSTAMTTRRSPSAAEHSRRSIGADGGAGSR